MKNAKACYRKMAYLNALGSSKHRLDSMNGHHFFLNLFTDFRWRVDKAKRKQNHQY